MVWAEQNVHDNTLKFYLLLVKTKYSFQWRNFNLMIFSYIATLELNIFLIN